MLRLLLILSFVLLVSSCGGGPASTALLDPDKARITVRSNPPGATIISSIGSEPEPKTYVFSLRPGQVVGTTEFLTALYMTQAHIKPSRSASPEMMRKTEEMYLSVGNEIGALVIPAGLAFEEAYRQRPDIKLHQDYDGSHPTQLGVYLAACTVYASLYGKSPVGNSYDYYGKVSKDEAAFLQMVADETVKKFFRR